MDLLVFALGWVMFWIVVIWACFKSSKGTNGSNY